MTKKAFLFIILLVSIFSGCYYDKTENTEITVIPENIIPDSYTRIDLTFDSYDTYVSFVLPENWYLEKRDIKPDEYPNFLTIDDSFNDVFDIFDNNHNNLGAIGFASCTNVDEKDNLMAIYSSVSMGNMYSFLLDEENYHAVKSDETGETAITKVYHSPSLVHNNGGLGNAVYGDGILSYSKECTSFIAVEFEEKIFNDDVLKILADGVRITPVTEEYTVTESALPPMIIMDGVNYFAHTLPVNELPDNYKYIGEIVAGESTDTGLRGCKYYAKENDRPFSAIYVYQECGTPIGPLIIDSTQRQWAYVEWIPE